jgi:MFS family permease
MTSVDESTTPTVDGPKGPVHSTLRKYVLLVMFCLAQFLDTFNISSTYSAIPTIEAIMGIKSNESAWIVATFQLTFAAFLLMSGKIADIYNPKHAFVAGMTLLGAVTLGTGFNEDKIALFVLRAIAGVFGSLTIPSALYLLVQVFPEPAEQARAFGIFGGFAAVGNTLGLVIGGIFVQYATWRWIYWFTTVVAFPIAALGVWLIPAQPEKKAESSMNKLRRLDIPGVAGLTAALIIFIFALTTAPADGWGSASVIAPLVISIVMIACFFFWERTLPVERAAIPSRTWFYPNFAVLFAASLLPFFWWTNTFTELVPLWQDGYGWSPISAAVHTLPIGISAIFFSTTGFVLKWVSSKHVLLFGHLCLIIATILLALDDTAQKYWSYNFPAGIIGSAAAMVVYTHNNIAIFRTCPPSMAGTVGAIFNSGLQLGSAAGISIVGSIQNSINGDDVNSYKGRAAGFWFTLGVVALETLAIVVFMKSNPEPPADESKQVSKESSPAPEEKPAV